MDVLWRRLCVSMMRKGDLFVLSWARVRRVRRGSLSSELLMCGEGVRSILLLQHHQQHVVVVYPLPWPLLVGGVRCSRLWSTSQLLRPSGQQCSHSAGVCPQIQGRQCGAYVGAVEEMMCVVGVDVTEGA